MGAGQYGTPLPQSVAKYGDPLGQPPMGQPAMPRFGGYSGPAASGADLPMQTRMNMIQMGHQPVDRSGWQAYTPQAIAAPTANSMMRADVPMAPQAPAPAPVAPPVEPARHQWQRRGGMLDGGGQLRADSWRNNPAIGNFFGMDPGFGGGVDPSTGQYVPASQLMNDQSMLRNYLSRGSNPYSIWANDPMAAARWRSSIRRRPGDDPLRTALYGPGAPL